MLVIGFDKDTVLLLRKQDIEKCMELSTQVYFIYNTKFRLNDVLHRYAQFSLLDSLLPFRVARRTMKSGPSYGSV